MKTAAVLFDNKNIPDSSPVDSFLKATVDKLKKFTGDIYFLSDKKADGVKNIGFGTARDFLDFLTKEFPKTEVLLLNAYSPLLDVKSLAEMLDEHRKLAFDYTYPENLPQGLLPEVLSADVARFIRETIPANAPLPRSNFRELFESDVSSYDTNIFINPSKLIKYRVHFIPDNLNDYLITREIVEKHGAGMDIAALEALIARNPGLIRKRPTYFEIELTGERETAFFPDGADGGEMTPADLKKVLTSIGGFSHSPVVVFGLYGEPFLHSAFGEIVEILRGFPGMRFLFESRGILTNFAPAAQALALPNTEVIFDISASDPSGFAARKKPRDPLLPPPDYQKLTDSIKALEPRTRIYPQFTRTADNEKDLMRFYDVWKDYGDRIIVRKPDTFGGTLDSLRVVDLSPIERHPCLHLKHDMFIRADGRVQLCREDFSHANPMGNILDGGIEACWEKMNAAYLAQWGGDYGKPPLCAGCDEWWVFNF
ncbi:MAG: spiro-SPASM protein [Brevinematales bacterium]|nr:spiro-SPASM protein [Brevinematales bacterium]